ncbi:MAG: sulfatase-like hydrolase/transferase [Planctomycetota bacterium]
MLPKEKNIMDNQATQLTTTARVLWSILIGVAFWSFQIDVVADQPNIVFLLADDLGYGDLACYGNPVIETPNLDQLAADGVRLLDCYAASPNCSPARTGIMTGRHPYRVGMYDFARFEPMHIPMSEQTLPEVIRSAGYQTMFAGKWHCSGDPDLATGSQPNPGDHGFDHWLAHPRNFGRNPSGFFRNDEPLQPLSGWMSEIVVNEAMNFIRHRDTSMPFLSVLWFSEPHVPVVAAREFIEPYERPEAIEAAKSLRRGGGPQVKWGSKEGKGPTYFGCVSMLDHHIGRLLQFLDAEGLRENTVVVFTSDNGPEHRPATSFGSPGALRGAKGHVHEGGYRVPGIIRWPNKIDAGTTSREPINGTDYLPSLAAVAGAAMHRDKPVDGVNVFPALTDGQPIARPIPMMWWLYHARGGKEVTMRVGDYKVLANMTPQKQIGTNDASPPDGMSRMDFIKHAELDNFTMFNLKEDPNETRELSKSQQASLEALKTRMIQLHSEIRSEGPRYLLGN